MKSSKWINLALFKNKIPNLQYFGFLQTFKTWLVCTKKNTILTKILCRCYSFMYNVCVVLDGYVGWY